MNELQIKITVQGLEGLVAAINRLAGQNAAVPQQTGGAGAPAQAVQMPIQMPIQAAQMPAQAPTMAPPTAPVPVTAPAAPSQPVQAVPSGAPVQGFSLEQLQVAAAGLMSAGKGQQVMGILQQFGIQAMTELPKERYGEFAMALRGAGAQV